MSEDVQGDHEDVQGDDEHEPGERHLPRGARPRILAPLLAAGMIALSLERLGVLHWFPALALFVLLGMWVVGLGLRRRKHAED